jgi:hypothetical protein
MTFTICPLSRRPSPLWTGTAGGKCGIMQYSRLNRRNGAMQKSLYNLMMIAVLHHLLAGCCWHHVHAGTGSGDAEGSRVSTCSCHDQQEHDDGHGLPSEPPGRRNGGCDRGKCSFVVSRTDDGDGGVDRTGVSGVACQNVAAPICPSVGHFSTEAPPPAGMSPHRLHLMNQVLLI